MTALILHDSATDIAIGLVINAGEVFQAETQIGVGIEQRRGRAREAERARGRELDLHQTVISSMYDPGIIVALDADDRIGEPDRDVVFLGMSLNNWAQGVGARLGVNALCHLLVRAFGLGSSLYKPGMTAADVAARAKATITAYDLAVEGA